MICSLDALSMVMGWLHVGKRGASEGRVLVNSGLIYFLFFLSVEPHDGVWIDCLPVYPFVSCHIFGKWNGFDSRCVHFDPLGHLTHLLGIVSMHIYQVIALI
jgi:hypothetical protein